ncbi:MAG: Gfo/Idh/MocA family oxidoreductase [Burkholderiales bacterium]|nr:MAG: Gfo/Idh/MocA family oxidoreductase [Burkholderiales bacterium]
MGHGIAVIGLGVVGRRMIEQAAQHAGIRVAAAWDNSAAQRAAAARDYPGLPMAEDARAAIERLDVAAVYVAVPPLAHREYVEAAVAAGKAVFCEKPLAVSLDEGRAMLDTVAGAGVPQAVNFPFASAPGVARLAERLDAAFGLRSIEVRVRFHRWPRDWQATATWLERGDQGGFTREVLSHFVYLLMRLRGTVELRRAISARDGDDAAEHFVAAMLDAGGIPVAMSGSVGGAAPDVIEAAFHGAGRTLRLVDFYRLLEDSDGQSTPVPDLPVDARTATYQGQLDQLAALLDGRPHTLCDFATALQVQTIVERKLAPR